MNAHLLEIICMIIHFLAMQALAQIQSPEVVGCETVGCPNVALTGKCTIVNESFIGTGVAPIVSDNTSFPFLSWVQNSRIDNSQSPNNSTNVDVFYLGAPANVSWGNEGTQACAVFFRQVNATFPGQDIGTATGTCASAMQQSCIDALTSRAKNLTVDTGKDPCGALQQEFTSNFDDVCSLYTTNNKWQGLSAQAIDISNAIRGDQNSTTDCWPVLPKSNDLIQVATFDTIGSQQDSLGRDLFELTPILSIFYAGDNSFVSETQAQLTCLKLIGSDPAATNNGTNTTSVSSKIGISSMSVFLGIISAAIGVLIL